MKHTFYSLLTGCIFFLTGQNTFGQAAALDSTFSLDGKVITSIGASDDFCEAIAIQADGKIVAAGYTNIAMLSNDFALVRYNADGSLDANFGVNGVVNTGIGASDDKCYGIAVQADGKIVVCGSSTASNNSDCAILRFNINGTQDVTFGTNGYVTIDLGSAFDRATSICIQADGKIVVGGSCTGSVGNSDFALIRLSVSGALDLTFGTAGIVKTNLALSSQDFIYAMALQSDGKIVACGTAGLTTGDDFGICRYNTDGSIDISFGANGIVTLGIGNAVDEAYGLTIQADGKIVVCGYSDNSNNDHDFAVIRLDVNGTLDAGFDGDGKVVTTIGTDDIARGLAIDANGRIIVCGSSDNGVKIDFAVVRYNTNGSLDLSFDLDGIATTSFGNNMDEGYCVAVQADGKAVAGGTTLSTNFDFALCRYKVTNITAVSEFTHASGVSACYNPLTSELLVNGTANKGEIIICDMTGKEIKRMRTANERTDCSCNFAPGCYLLTYLEGNKVANMRIMLY